MVVNTLAPRHTTQSHDTWTADILGLPTFTIPVLRTLEAEVDAYLLDSQVGTTSLNFWQVSKSFYAKSERSVNHLQENQHRFPTIFALAMDILPIQASSVPCECVFSSAKETMSAQRNRIGAELMEALQMLKFSVVKGCGINFTSGTSREDELRVLEEYASDEASILEDMMAFICSLDVFKKI